LTVHSVWHGASTGLIFQRKWRRPGDYWHRVLYTIIFTASGGYQCIDLL
jgi:hypothetical protein